MKKRMTSDSSVKYERMEIDDGYIDKQFKRQPVKIPWKSISMAIILCFMGTALLVVGALLVSGKIDGKYNDRLWPVMILGVILFLPGFYHVRIAVYAYSGYEGYSYEDIPDYDD
ncbi:transmembrane protein 230-like [Apostichopus japonicus]|uniref:transmembrane protein 230-like n=1 Tax=Stichopus japonicus TaxID=307972 RepID=UPI003AB2285E